MSQQHSPSPVVYPPSASPQNLTLSSPVIRPDSAGEAANLSASATAPPSQPPVEEQNGFCGANLRGDQNEVAHRSYFTTTESHEEGELLPLHQRLQQQQPSLSKVKSEDDEGLVSISPNADDTSNSGSTGGSMESNSSNISRNCASNGSSNEGSSDPMKGDSGLGNSDSPSLYDSGSNESDGNNLPDQQQQQQHLPLKLRWKVS